MRQRTCTISGCGKREQARSWCSAHYSRWRRWGDPLAGGQALTPSSTCRVCDAPVSDARGSYCSRKCRSRASYLIQKAKGAHTHRKPPVDQICVECGSAFAQARLAECCSNRCRQRRADRENPKRCTVGGCTNGVRAKGMCAKHWRRLARSEGREKAPDWTPARRAAWKARQELIRGASTSEPIIYDEVFARDGWICQICGVPVDESLVYPSPMSKSLDHVIPLSRGGAHIEGNVQLAHLSCNLRKGARVAAEGATPPSLALDLGAMP